MKDINTVMNIGYFEEYEMSDLEERRLFINGVIDDEVIDTIVYHILRYNQKFLVYTQKLGLIYLSNQL